MRIYVILHNTAPIDLNLIEIMFPTSFNQTLFACNKHISGHLYNELMEPGDSMIGLHSEGISNDLYPEVIRTNPSH